MALVRPKPKIIGGSKEINMTDEFNKTVKYLEDNIFHKNTDTDNTELNKVCKELFGSEFGGIYPEDMNINFNDKKSYYIFNTDKSTGSGIHWIAVYVDHENKHVYVFDTFHRQISKLTPDLYLDIKNDGFKVKTTANKIHQKDCQLDCGQRSLSLLILIKKYGLDAVLNSNF